MKLSSYFDGTMIISPTTFIITIAIIVGAIIYRSLIKRKGFPPGPMGLPVIGYWPFFKNETCAQQLQSLKDIYGDVFSFTSTGYLYVNLGSIKAVREAHITKSECFSERISGYTLMVDYFKDGVFAVNGEAWKVLRKFFIQALRESGQTTIKSSTASSLYESINSTVEMVKAKNGEPMNILGLLAAKCNTILRLTLFGESGMSEETIAEFNKHYGGLIAGMTPRNLFVTGALGKYLIFPLTPSYRASLREHKKLEEILQKVIQENISTYDENNTRNVMDIFIHERNQRKKKSDTTAEYFTDGALLSSMIQFVGDGVLGVSALISLFFKCLMKYPEEQQKVYREIIDVVGVDREPAIEDKSKMTYTNAFILEVLRVFGPEMFPFFPSLECTKETTIGGYRIPKGAITLVNMYSAHKDSETYEEPEVFNPSRFIHSEGKRKPEIPITFGVGKRACVGEGFTMMQTFLFLTTLVKHFKFLFPKNEEGKLNTFDGIMSDELLVCARLRS